MRAMRYLALAGGGALLLLTGCEDRFGGLPCLFRSLIIAHYSGTEGSNHPYQGPYAKAGRKIKGTGEIRFGGHIASDGTFVADDDLGGTSNFMGLNGTTVKKSDVKYKIVGNDNPGSREAVRTALRGFLGFDVSVESAKFSATVKADKEQPDAAVVNGSLKGKVRFTATVISGPDTGKKYKGKIKAKTDDFQVFEPAQ